MTETIRWLLLGLTLLSLPACAPRPEGAGAATDEFAERRRRLVEHLRASGIRDEGVLKAMSEVPRHRFVPAAQAGFAYENRPLAIGHGQTISQPYIVAYMTEAAEVAPGEKVLEVGTGSGYQAAVLSRLAGEVYSVEIIPELAAGASKLLGELGYRNVRVRAGNGYEGWAEHAPFDAVVVTAAPEEVPRALVEQLAVGGKMVVPVGKGEQEMVVITKTAAGVVERRTIPVRFVPMTGAPKN
jgi:protein-L-isoaspartate(D-aspartate) O-methyltransferase